MATKSKSKPAAGPPKPAATMSTPVAWVVPPTVGPTSVGGGARAPTIAEVAGGAVSGSPASLPVSWVVPPTSGFTAVGGGVRAPTFAEVGAQALPGSPAASFSPFVGDSSESARFTGQTNAPPESQGTMIAGAPSTTMYGGGTSEGNIAGAGPGFGAASEGPPLLLIAIAAAAAFLLFGRRATA